jgi:hypothetical protein
MRTLIAALMLGAVCTSPLTAQESRIRQAGQDQVVAGSLNSPLLFTTTGFLSDQVLIAGPSGCFAWNTIRNLRSSPLVQGVVYHSGGQVSLRWCFYPSPCLLGGGVAILRGSTLTDYDPIHLY